MKIIYLIKAFAEKGGVERVICDKMNFIAEQGHEVFLITYIQGEHHFPYSINSSIKHYDLNTRFFELNKYNLAKRIIGHIKLRHLFKQRLQTLLDQIQPDIFITTTFQFGLTDILTNIQTNAKMLIESHIAFERVLFTTVHQSNKFLAIISKPIDRYFFAKTNRFYSLISLTKGDAEEWKKYIKNVRIIPNPITNYPQIIRDYPDKIECHRIICVGRLCEQKGYDLLIKAFCLIANQCPQWHIDIFGHGEDEKKLKDLIKKVHLENQIIINQPTFEIYTEYSKSAFLVLSSRHEGYPLVLNEAMSCGIPCVAFDCKYGPKDAIYNKKNGLLVENRNIEKLSKAILWMIQHPKERLEMGKIARETSSRYKKEIIMQEWLKLFESCLLEQ